MFYDSLELHTVTGDDNKKQEDMMIKMIKFKLLEKKTNKNFFFKCCTVP